MRTLLLIFCLSITLPGQSEGSSEFLNVLRFSASLKNHAEGLRRRGGTDPGFEWMIEKRLGLSLRASRAFDAAVRVFAAEQAGLDVQAREIRTRARSSQLDSQVASRALMMLEKERADAAERARNRLRSEVGEAEFQRISTAVIGYSRSVKQ